MSADEALVDLLHSLGRHGYRFTAVTPSTHAIVLGRSDRGPPDLRGIFGWNRAFELGDLDPVLLRLLERAEALENDGHGKLRSRVRVATFGEDLFVHSAFPTTEADAVFFGPDTYRFARFIKHRLGTIPGHIVDMGTGSGASGIAAIREVPAARVTLVDVNPEALRFARINARVAGVDVETVQSDRVPEDFDVLIANAPYMMDPSGRAYRDGGGLLGGAISLDWVRQGLKHLESGKTFLLYTGAAYVAGEAPLLNAVAEECRSAGALLSVDEIDPDVFGEELRERAYEAVERIAAVGIRMTSAAT